MGNSAAQGSAGCLSSYFCAPLKVVTGIADIVISSPHNYVTDLKLVDLIFSHLFYAQIGRGK